MAEPDVPVHILLAYGICEIEGHLALILNYATSQERIDRDELDAFAIAMPRDMAAELGAALIERAQEPYQ
jgi:hypothetical protein